MELDGKIAFVTGGSRGIGKAIALEMAREGAEVAFNYHRNEEAARETAEEIAGETGREPLVRQMDVRDRDAVNAAYEATVERFGGLHVLVNNAGINNPTDFDQVTGEEWDEILGVNLKGPFICSQAALPFMADSGGGSIVMIGSVSGQYGGPRTAHYAASKAGLISLGQVVARFGAQYDVRCNTLSAGLIQSEMAAEGMKSEAVQQAAEDIVLSRLGTPREVAQAAVYLASDASSYITAQTVNVNGGLYF